MEEFNVLTDPVKKRTLEAWRKKYKDYDVYRTLGIGQARYYKLLEVYDVERKKLKMRSLLLSPEELSKVINGCKFSKEKFLQLSDTQRKLIIDGITKKFTVTEIADLWNTTKNVIYGYIYRCNEETYSIGNRLDNVINGGKFSRLDFLSLNEEERIQVMTGILSKFTPKEISKFWDTDITYIYNYKARYGKSQKIVEPQTEVETTAPIKDFIYTSAKQDSTPNKLEIYTDVDDRETNFCYRIESNKINNTHLIDKLKSLIALLEVDYDFSNLEVNLSIKA